MLTKADIAGYAAWTGTVLKTHPANGVLNRALDKIVRLLADRESLLQQVETAREEGRRAGLEEAARAAEFYATTNLEMAGDTVLHDPAFRPGPKDWAKSKTLMVMGCIHSAKHEAGNQIAANVRASLQGDQPK